MERITVASSSVPEWWSKERSWRFSGPSVFTPVPCSIRTETT